jgi:ferredoxin, 2Fe-2S
MTQVTFIEFNGKVHTVAAQNGLSLMRAAVDNNVPGIDADCGGSCACATCHVYITPEWQGKLGKQSKMEEDMLDFAASTQPNSRLACQINIDEALDGLVVTMPEGQH